MMDSDRFDLISFLNDYSIPYTESGKNVSRGWVGIQCPFPDCSDQSNHCGIHRETKIFKCFICGRKGGISYLIKFLLNISPAEVNTIVNRYNTLDGGLTKPETSFRKKHMKPPIGADNLFSDKHLQYLHDRKFKYSIILKYGLLATHEIGDWKFRIVAPVIMDGITVNYVGRDITGRSDERYKNLGNEEAILPISECLYNIDSIKPGTDILVVEGITDVWRIGDGCIATFGSNISQKQLLKINSKAPNQVHVLFDPEIKAQTKARSFGRSLSLFCPTEVLCLNGNKDPADLDKDEVKELRSRIFRK